MIHRVWPRPRYPIIETIVSSVNSVAKYGTVGAVRWRGRTQSLFLVKIL